MMTQRNAWEFLAVAFENSAKAGRCLSPYTERGLCLGIILLRCNGQITGNVASRMNNTIYREMKRGYWFPIFAHAYDAITVGLAVKGAHARVAWIRNVMIPSLNKTNKQTK